MIKKIIIIAIITALIFTTFTVSFAGIGEILGEVITTDIVTYFDGIEFPSFNFNGKTGIYASDLRKAGFNVIWDGENRQVVISSDETVSTDKTTNTNNTTETVDLGNIVYSDKIELTLPKHYNNGGLSVVDSEGNNISGIAPILEKNKIYLDKTYYLKLGEEFTLSINYGKGTSRYTFFIEESLSKSSFKQGFGLWQYNSVILPPNEEKGYSFPFRLMYPKRNYISNSKFSFDDTLPELLLSSSNHFVDESFEHMMMASIYRDPFSTEIVCRTDFNAFTMYGIFPRLGDEGGLYTHSLDRQTVFGTQEFMDSFDRGNLYRIDKQFVNMYKESKRLLGNLGVKIDKPILTGFSAGSDFMSRLNYLHPDLAKAVIINDPPTLPMTEYNGTKLRFPLGVGDLHEITGEEFSKEKFLDTPQFWTTGSQDTNDGTYFSDGWGSYTLERPGHRSGINSNQEGIDYRELFGQEILSRKENIKEILKEEGFTNIESHVYDTGHGTTDQTMVDVEKFLKTHIDY